MERWERFIKTTKGERVVAKEGRATSPEIWWPLDLVDAGVAAWMAWKGEREIAQVGT